MRKPPNETLELSDDGSSGHVPERTCILTREAAPRASLIRLALGPDGTVAPDVRAKAPGRGAWIGVDRAALEAAQAKGKLKAALARAFKTGAVTIPDDLGARIEAALRQAVLDRLGLEARAGNLVTGGEKIDVALRRGEVRLLIHASDAAADGRGKRDQALRVGTDGEERQGLVFPADRTILSLALGRQNVVHVAILDPAAAARVRDLLSRWGAFIGRDAALEAASAASGASAHHGAAERHEGQE
ncbi:DUF448 domain-containing protein [Sphingosinicella sp. YJ22]|uniref:DUF448 domain-containing protein n=1 Tax=Sphingosinicella sp. YJ22 TaxID=1104780 RepID=UPI001FAF6C1F|nr:DUF448 domain-containing protein [Sphingosinicella sp. YJ22]